MSSGIGNLDVMFFEFVVVVVVSLLKNFNLAASCLNCGMHTLSCGMQNLVY